MNRQRIDFESGGTNCVAWHYPGSNGACVVMGAGLAVTKEPGTDPFAPRFQEAGFSVLAFDFRGFGESGGEPRQVMRIADQQADFHAAIACARALPEVDPERVAIWGFSLSAAHVFEVAAADPRLAAAIAVGAPADGRAITPNALRHTTPLSLVKLLWRAASGGMVALAGERGEVAALTTPDSRNGARALEAERYPEWRQEVSARSALSLGSYRAGRRAPDIACPLLVVASEDDGVAPQGPTIAAAQRAPHGEVARIPGGHYAAYLDAREQALEAQLAFLGRVLGAQRQPEQREEPLGVEEEGEVRDLSVSNVGDDD